MALPAILGTGFLSQVLGYVFAYALARVVVKVVAALGMGYVAYVGFDTLITEINGYLDTTMAGLPVLVFQVVNIVNIPAAINLILSAYTARYTLLFLNKKIVFNPPSP